MESHDVPQANSLRKLRDVLQALELGASKPAEIERLAELTIRHVGYYLHAGRALRLCALEQSAWNLTDRGRRLLSTQRDSDAERRVWREAIRTSPTVQRLAPTLLDERRPDMRSLASRIEGESKLRPATAARRAAALLSWRDQVMGRAEVEQVALPLFGDRHETPSTEQAHPILSMFVARVQTRGFGLLRSVDVALGPFNCLIGANATGKSTFLDVVAFLADVVREGVVAAVARRANALEDLLSFKTGDAFELAIEVLTPSASPKRPPSRLRYELRVGNDASMAPTILGETLYILPDIGPSTSGLTYHVRLPLGWRKVVRRTESGKAYFEAERGGWKVQWDVSERARSALAELASDTQKFPLALRLRSLLLRGVQRLQLDSKAMAMPSSPIYSGSTWIDDDGARIASAVRHLQVTDPTSFEDWTDHVREAISNLKTIRVVERPEDKHLYLRVVYSHGLELPAWRVSDGTLRILGLTLIAYAAHVDHIFLIEEPENGIHPVAVQTVLQSLSSVGQHQVILATHSPIVLDAVRAADLRCFTRHVEGTFIQTGDAMPAVRNWKGTVRLGELLASGVLS